MSPRFTTSAILAGALFAAAPLSADTFLFQQGVSPSTGYQHLAAELREGSATTNMATNIVTLVGHNPTNSVVLRLRTGISFDLSLIPADQIITAISLTMTVGNTGTGTVSGLGNLSLSEVVPNGSAANDMVEAGVTWNAWSSGNNWTTAGGDFGSALTSGIYNDTTSNNNFDNGETVTFASTAAFVAAAQASFLAGRPLEMMLVAPFAEAAGPTANNFVRFASDDNATASFRPLLTVTTIPEPGTAICLLGGLAVLLCWRRREARSR